jgi:RNA-directed DNA polymerase
MDKVRELRRRLWVAAKRAPKRRFHALFDRIYRGDVLLEAWERVRRNQGAAGVDGQSIAEVEAVGVESFLEGLAADLREGRYRPRAVLRRYIPKADGRRRPLGIPTVRDRVVQMAAKLVLEPVFEADFLPGNSGGHFVLEVDIRDYFGSIDHEKLLQLVELRVSDRRVLKLVRQWLRAGVMEDGVESRVVAGTPQGGVISPLLSNIYLHYLDLLWMRHCSHLGELVRYADDFVVICKSKGDCERALARVRAILERLGLELHPEKTRIVSLFDGEEAFDFLCCHLRKRMSGRIWERQGKPVYFLNRWPSKRAMKRVRQRVKELTPRRRCHEDIREVIRDLNPVLRGWGNYFRTGNASRCFNALDLYVWERLYRLCVARKGRHVRPGDAARWTRDIFYHLGLHRLGGTVQYPAPVRRIA